MLVDERHRGGTFTDRAADALDRSGSHVTDRKHARDARFESTGEPALGALRGWSRSDKSVLVEREAAATEPFGFGISADEDERVPHLMCCLDAVALVAPRNRCEPAPCIAAKLRNLRVGVKLDRERCRDAGR
jgi:hypothetical protein